MPVDLTEHNQALVNNFQYYLKVEKGLSRNTLQGYLLDLRNLLSYQDNSAEELTTQDLINYFISLQEIGLSASTIARKRSSISTFYKFLQEEGITLALHLDSLPAFKYSPKIPDVLSVDEMLCFLDRIPSDNALGMRNKAMVELMYASGLRISEMIGLSIHDINWSERVVRITGKGSKQRVVPVADKSMSFLLRYLELSRPALKKETQTDVLFLNRAGRKLSRMGVWKILNKLALDAGIKKHISPHTIRHSFATHLLEAGANLRIVQLLLGHASINTTQIYTNIDKNYIIKEHKLYHPRG
ncbi:MAG: tyrosine recombinase XerD [Candidatus Cloacimonetes bacterium]|nr:tyrosine recombinase XerD [Candidatus Cloacimonadota bacterium]